jgi:hypothetical protein
MLAFEICLRRNSRSETQLIQTLLEREFLNDDNDITITMLISGVCVRVNLPFLRMPGLAIDAA